MVKQPSLPPQRPLQQAPQPQRPKYSYSFADIVKRPTERIAEHQKGKYIVDTGNMNRKPQNLVPAASINKETQLGSRKRSLPDRPEDSRLEQPRKKICLSDIAKLDRDFVPEDREKEMLKKITISLQQYHERRALKKKIQRSSMKTSTSPKPYGDVVRKA